jgi:SAM-dependent methyltransferase
MSETNEKRVMSVPRAAGTPLYILAPFVPTPPDVVDRMLQLGEVTSQDSVYDLGCGDGRIIIAAAKKCGARGVGLDIEPYRVAESQSNAQAAGVEQLVTFKHQDAMTVDLSEATVVMIYLVHWSTEKLLPIIAKAARAGTRVISHNFGMADWTPIRTEEFRDKGGETHTLYLWIVGTLGNDQASY